MKEVCMRCFNNPIIDIEINENTVTNPPVLLYGDFIQIGAAKENRIYEELINIQKLKTILQVNMWANNKYIIFNISQN